MPVHLPARSRSGTRASSASDLTAAASAAEDVLAAAAAAPATPPHGSVGLPSSLLGTNFKFSNFKFSNFQTAPSRRSPTLMV